ncbi:MAG: TMEM175 family protein [Thermomicrobiales bacterium]
MSEELGTGRLELFSDGVFAIAVTLLVLELRVPLPGALADGSTLREALWQEWPTYLAFATSFATFLIAWVNHQNLFRLIARVDHTFLLLNGLLLATITFIPFPTHVLAEYLREPGPRTAAVFYVGSFLVMALAFNLLWH